jgi:NADP-dependent 3-hydroxy acid dehydrogenase YdfG
MFTGNAIKNCSNFSGQVAMVTGSSSGVGKALALALASHGATLCLLGRDLHRLYRVRDEIGAGWNRSQCYPIDLTQESDIQELQLQVQKDFGNVDILVHSAGVIRLGGVQLAPVEDFDLQYRINVRAAFSLSQAMLPLLKAHRGQFVFVNSFAGLTANANTPQYSATKHAMTAIANSLREEVNPIGIRVLNLFIGCTATPMQVALHAAAEKPYQPERFLQPDDIASVVLNALSLPRTAEVTEIKIRPLIKP